MVVYKYERYVADIHLNEQSTEQVNCFKYLDGDIILGQKIELVNGQTSHAK